MNKLTTAAGVIDWCTRNTDRYGDWRGNPEDAAYIAECVRLRQAFECEMETMACFDHPNCKCRMSVVRAALDEVK